MIDSTNHNIIDSIIGEGIIVDESLESKSNIEILEILCEIDEPSYEVDKLIDDNWLYEKDDWLNDENKNHIFKRCECGFYGYLHMKRIKCPECRTKFKNYKKYLKINRRYEDE